jgi:uncharacterized protein
VKRVWITTQGSIVRLFVDERSILMARYPTRNDEVATAEERADVANPIPLGLCVLAFITAVLGSYYAGFIIPYNTTGSRATVGGILLIAGIVELLAGMWEFRRDNTIAATVFSSYGAFAGGLGLVYLWGGAPFVGPSHLAFGLLLLIWSIFLGVLLLASLRTNHLLTATLGLVFAFYVIVTIGQLAFDNRVLLIIGGWVGIAGALVAWFAALGAMTGVPGLRDNLRMPAR